MITPLPKVYNWAFDKAYEDEVVAQPQQPVDGQSSNGSIGNCVNIERMEKALEDMNTRLDTEVYKPLQEWMSGYKDVQVRPCLPVAVTEFLAGHLPSSPG